MLDEKMQQEAREMMCICSLVAHGCPPVEGHLVRCDDYFRGTEAVVEHAVADAEKRAQVHLALRVRAEAERDEAREWVERMQQEARVLTCVYCGHAYEPGTPTHGTQTLTDHIKVCEKHPLRQAENRAQDLLKALEWIRSLDCICGGDGHAPTMCGHCIAAHSIDAYEKHHARLTDAS